MKLVSRNVALLLFATISIVSCKDDEPAKKPDNKFTIADNSYEVESAVFLKDMSIGYDIDENVYYRNSVFLITEGITTSLVNEETRASGAGDAVELMLNNAGQTLEAGTYTWQAEENEQPFDFWSGSVMLSWNSAVPDSGTEFNFTEGTVVVAKSGDTYTITFEGLAVGDANHDEILDAPVAVSGQFVGTLSPGQRDF